MSGQFPKYRACFADVIMLPVRANGIRTLNHQMSPDHCLIDRVHIGPSKIGEAHDRRRGDSSCLGVRGHGHPCHVSICIHFEMIEFWTMCDIGEYDASSINSLVICGAREQSLISIRRHLISKTVSSVCTERDTIVII